MNERRKWTIVLMMIAVFVATAAFFLPGLVRAGNLEPSAAPGSTMKTLDEVPPTWSQKLPASERFELVFPVIFPVFPFTINYKAVLDKETGLVWERYPDTTTTTWFNACAHCYKREVGGRKGWRLPTVEELASLIDTTNTNPALPTGHPFSIVQSGHYWSSSTGVDFTGYAWVGFLDDGGVHYNVKGGDCYVWCVRGGHGHDAY